MQKRSTHIVLELLSAAGILLSLVSLYHFAQARFCPAAGPSFCDISAQVSCSAVNLSRWSEFLGLPVASWGLFFYAVLLVLLFGVRSGRVISAEKGYPLLFAASIVACVLSLALFAISEFIIGSLCIVCIAMYAVNFLLLAFSYLAVRPTGAAAALARGATAMLDAVLVFRGSTAKLPARLSLWICAVICAAIAVMSPVVAAEIAITNCPRNKMTPEQHAAQVAAYVEAWKAEPVVTLPVSTPGVLSGDYALGEPDAAVKILEFADFECSACRRFYETVHALMEEFPGAIQLTFRNYPLDSSCNPSVPRRLHPHSCFAAEFARCAGEQEKFWEVADLIFTGNYLEAGSDQEVRAALIGRAVESGLDDAALTECVESGRYREKIAQDVAAANGLGIGGTPAVWINSKRLAGVHIDIVREVIRSILAQSGK